MLKELYLYDLLRTDRTTSAFGLEVRVPFASKDFLKYIMNIDTGYKRFSKNELEKNVIREAFKEYLPESILQRKKHAFSDSVSGGSVNWYKNIVLHAQNNIDKTRYERRTILYPYNTPIDEESFWYREIFESFYPGRYSLTPKYWMPKIKGVNITDPSATVLEGFKEK
jgi:asparagine synthase (glutamine-hydrolysing)